MKESHAATRKTARPWEQVRNLDSISSCSFMVWLTSLPGWHFPRVLLIPLLILIEALPVPGLNLELV